jgi:ribosomal protein S5
MNDDEGHGRSEGDDASLADAIVKAWEDAKKKSLPPGTYVVHKIEIETTNPIHAYAVTIKHAGN